MVRPSFKPEEVVPKAPATNGMSHAKPTGFQWGKALMVFWLGWSLLSVAAIFAVQAGALGLLFALLFPPRVFTPPELSDFTPPYTCPTSLAPRSCTTPIKVAVECVDLRTIDPRNLTRPLTETELSNGEKACELLPLWLDQDPRIEIVGDGQDFDLALKYRISSAGRSFTSTHVFVDGTNFGVVKPFQRPHDTAAYFVEQSLLELGKRGYLP
jgi:hypothetical protein